MEHRYLETMTIWKKNVQLKYILLYINVAASAAAEIVILLTQFVLIANSILNLDSIPDDDDDAIERNEFIH